MPEISMDKKYKTVAGDSARVICIDRNNKSFPVIALVTNVVGEVVNEDHVAYTAYGKYWDDGTKDQRDLVELSEYEEFKIDEPVMVRECTEDSWQPMHFAGIDKYDRPTTWPCGGTSWTSSEDSQIHWEQCRKPTKEELENKSK